MQHECTYYVSYRHNEIINLPRVSSYAERRLPVKKAARKFAVRHSESNACFVLQNKSRHADSTVTSLNKEDISFVIPGESDMFQHNQKKVFNSIYYQIFIRTIVALL